MANKINLVPLNKGLDTVTDDILLEPGYVRTAHNMEVAIGGGLRRVKGWNNPWQNAPNSGGYYDRPLAQTVYDASATTSQLASLSLVGHGFQLFAFRGEPYDTTLGRRTHPLQMSQALVTSTQESGSPELDVNDSHNNSWTIWPFLFDESLDGVTSDDCYSHIAYRVKENFSSYSGFTSSNGPPQAVCVTYDGDILWKRDEWFIMQHDSPNHPAHAITALGWSTDGVTAVGYSQDRLLIGTYNGVLLISSIGDPFDFDTVNTASTMEFDSNITNIVELPEKTIFVSTNDSIHLIYPAPDGTNDADAWEKKTVTHETGAVKGSAQRVGNDIYFLTRSGVTSLAATQKYGNFLAARLADRIHPLTKTHPANVYDAWEVTSATNAYNSQYIVFHPGLIVWDFAAQENVIIEPKKVYLGFTAGEGEDPHWTTADYPSNLYGDGMQLIHHQFLSLEAYFFVGEDPADSDERVVKRWLDGWSQDGVAYTSYFSTPYLHFNSPYVDKTYRKIMMTAKQEATPNVANPELTLNIATSFDNGVDGQPNDSQITSTMQGANWSTDAWGEFIWGAGEWGVGDAYSNGNGQNVSVVVSHTSATTKPYTIKTLSFVYENRRVDH